MSEQLPAVQMRLGFDTPDQAVTLTLSLSGLFVIVEPDPGQFDAAWSYLTACGADPIHHDQLGIRVRVGKLHTFAHLPTQVRVRCVDPLGPLYLLATTPSPDGVPATLTVEPTGELRLSWFDGLTNRDELLERSLAAALLNAEVPFEATSEAWGLLKSSCFTPVLVARARMNLDGFVELAVTTSAQLLETAPLPGLFRVDDGHFGLALPYAGHLDAKPGFLWDGRRPSVERGPVELPEGAVELSGHAASDLRHLVDQLAAYRAQAIAWDSGLGRRVFALAALEALDAWPALIVTTPAGVWLWQRHLDLFGRSYALSHDRADAHLVTYRDLAARRTLPSPQAIIFDAVTSAEASSDPVRAALHRLDGLADGYRLAVVSDWPEDPAAQVEVMSLLRPGEFREDVPLARRYPINTDQRAREHVAAYVSRRRAGDPGTDRRSFRRSSAVTVTPTEAQLRALADLADRYSTPGVWQDPRNQLAQTLEIVSAGPQHAVSPKVAAVAARARAAVAAGRRVAVLTRHVRTATLIAATLRPTKVLVMDASEGEPPADALAVVVRFDRSLPSLRAMDEVLVVDYPWSTEVLERAIGAASDSHGPSQVTVVHATGTVDDRLAMLAARRRENALVSDPAAAPNPTEVEYLLTPRA